MNLKHCATTFLVCAGMAALPATSLAAGSPACTAGKPTSRSYTWDFHKEASRLLGDMQADASKIEQHASTADIYSSGNQGGWQLQAGQLMSIRREVNDMGRKLCRLDAIRRVVAPWQQEAIDRTAPAVVLMVNSAEDALNFLNNNQRNFWMPAYRKYVANLNRDSSQVSNSIKNFEDYAKVQGEDLHLGTELGVKARS